MVQKIRRYQTTPRITGVKILDTLLHFFSSARDLVIAESGSPNPSPTLIAKRAYVLVEQSNIPHATKYRYKAFIRELARALNIGNIRVRKNALAKVLKKMHKSKIKAYKEALPKEIVQKYHSEQYETPKIYEEKEYEPSPEEYQEYYEEPSGHWQYNEDSGEHYGGYEDMTSYFDWEE